MIIYIHLIWAFVAVIGFLVIRDLVREQQRHDRDIDLIDRAIPRTDAEHKNQTFSFRMKELGKKRGKRKKGTEAEEEKAGGGPGPQPSTKQW